MEDNIVFWGLGAFLLLALSGRSSRMGGWILLPGPDECLTEAR